MTEPRIQYAKTSDGVNIAFWTLGEGTPLVYMPGMPVSHIQLEWQIPVMRAWYERLAERLKVVRYDPRGAGLSERNVTKYALDAYLLDLEAVVDRLSLDQFALFGLARLGPVAIAYAARHPERVSHLLLWSTVARGSHMLSSSQMKTLATLRDKDWDIYTETAAHLSVGWSDSDLARRGAALLRESIAQEALVASMAATSLFDVADMLPQVTTPALVLHRRQHPWLDVDVARELVTGMRNASLVLLEGESIAPIIGDTDAVLRAINEFLGEGEEAEIESEGLSADIVHTILFTDVEGSTALTDRLGDAKARDLLREHERIVREALKAHGGSEVKTMGDGFMVSFSSATKALGCAIAMQQAFAEHNEAAEEPIHVRIGLNAGEPIAEDDPDGRSDLFGASVNRTARIAAMAQGGEILVANVVRELAEGKEFLFGDRGETALRGFDDPVRLFEVRWKE